MADDQEQTHTDPSGAAPRSTPNAARDTDGRGAANAGEGPMDPDTEAVTAAFERQGAESGGADDLANPDAPEGGVSRDGPDAVDLEDFSGGSRREPGR